MWPIGFSSDYFVVVPSQPEASFGATEELEYQRLRFCLEPAWLPRCTVLYMFGAWARISCNFFFSPSNEQMNEEHYNSKNQVGVTHNILIFWIWLHHQAQLTLLACFSLPSVFCLHHSYPHPSNEHLSFEYLQWIVPWSYPCSPAFPPCRQWVIRKCLLDCLFLKPFGWFPIWSRHDSDVTTALTQFSCCSPSLSGIQTHCFLLIQQTEFVPTHLRAFAHAVPASWNASPFINSFISLPYKNLFSSSRRSQSLFWALLAHAPPTYLQGATLRLRYI